MNDIVPRKLKISTSPHVPYSSNTEREYFGLSMAVWDQHLRRQYVAYHDDVGIVTSIALIEMSIPTRTQGLLSGFSVPPNKISS